MSHIRGERHASVRSGLWLAVACTPFLTGCGLIFVNAPPTAWETSQDLEAVALVEPCTDSKTLVVLDGVMAGLNALGGAAWLAEDEFLYPDKNAYAIGGFAWAGLFGISAASGNSKVEECRRFQAALLEQRRASELALGHSVSEGAEQEGRRFGPGYYGFKPFTPPQGLFPETPLALTPIQLAATPETR